MIIEKVLLIYGRKMAYNVTLTITVMAEKGLDVNKIIIRLFGVSSNTEKAGCDMKTLLKLLALLHYSTPNP